MFSPIVSRVVNAGFFQSNGGDVKEHCMVYLQKEQQFCIAKHMVYWKKTIRCEWTTRGTNLEILVGEFIDFAFKHLKEFVNSNIKV
jgi:hypothetical protein